ncbi:MAG: glycoside hydrolase family 43 protein [Oscillospiraceae bacterium]|jgi:hypothetical protein|nr:glycoside hydrolase family 43 protein [Oscillospiraceae bacterium]
MKREDLQIRDPFILVDNDRYILLGSTDKNIWNQPGNGFEAYTSRDLEEFTYAGTLFKRTDSFWGTHDFWAPEMHKYKGAYYIFATFITPGRMRGTAILRSDNPLGPFTPWGEERATPPEWMCLDGTLHVDDAGDPWIVFCHEWVQIGAGTICARRLAPDLSAPIGEPVTLFAATDAAWPRSHTHSSGRIGYITDGPFLTRSKSGALWMLWSSLTAGGYAIGLAISDGGILGPWRQTEKPIFAGDGGHGMVFRDLSGELRLAIHTPNDTPNERPLFLRIAEDGEGYVIL